MGSSIRGESFTSPIILAIDAGTTSIRALLFDHRSQVLGTAVRPLTPIMPGPGLVEQDPLEIWSLTRAVCAEVLARTGIPVEAVSAIGVAAQRATTLIWEKATGRPLYNALTWQDGRTGSRFAELTERLGFPVLPMTSLTRMEWLLQHVPGARAAVQSGEALIGTVDSWLIWHLTGRRAFVTDSSCAMATQVWDPPTGQWSAEVSAFLGVPPERLASIRPSSSVYGQTDPDLLGVPIPVSAAVGDQPAALFGHLCDQPGMGKVTFGTAVMADLHTGTDWRGGEGSYPVALWRLHDQDAYGLEGAVISAGSSLEWLREMGVADSVAQIFQLAATVPDSGGVSFVPALQGLGTPFLAPDVRGSVTGLTRATTRAHLARAALEGIAFRTNQMVKALRRDAPGEAFALLHADGGLAESDLFLQLQADVTGLPVQRLATTQVTALGAAYMAGLAVGVWPDLDTIRAERMPVRRFEAGPGAQRLQECYAEWLRPLDLVRRLSNPHGSAVQ